MKNSLQVLLLLCIPLFSQSQLPRTVFKELWGTHFQLRKTEQGEILSISSAFVSNNMVYLYDMAERKIVALDSSFSFIEEIPLATIGRFTYVGDDFVVQQGEAIFLNTVDRRLEIFDLKTGNHKASVKYPHNYFSNEQKRRHRIINKIFLDGELVVLGNSHKLFYFDLKSKKPVADKIPVTLKEGRKYLVYNSRQPITRSSENIKWKDTYYQAIQNSFLISGKQYFIFNDNLYAFTLDNSRICIVRVEENSK